MSSELVPAHRAFVPSRRPFNRSLLHRATSGLLPLVTIAAAVTGGSGCYSSQWGEQERAQRRLAAHVAPSTLGARSEPEGGDGEASHPRAATPAAHVLRMRVYVTPAYAAQTLDVGRQVRDLVSDANALLAAPLAGGAGAGAGAGARIVVEGMASWVPPVAEDSLAAVLAALQAKDAADGIDLVVGLIGGMSSASQSFHELGMAPIHGKHLVVRAAGSLDEHDAVESAFSELHDDERAGLRKELKRHRATAVFLHEVGHTLGAMHEIDPRSLMHFEYARGMAGFSREGAAIMRIALAHRSPSMRAEHPDDERAWATELRAYLDRVPPRVWADADYKEMRQRVDSALAAPLPGAADDAPVLVASLAPVTPAAAAPPPAVPGLSVADARVFDRAVDARRGGAIEEAWKTARPLFGRYPAVYEVQDLRCSLAMKRPLGWMETRAECDALMRLSAGVGKK
jgi:hypothetical protein